MTDPTKKAAKDDLLQFAECGSVVEFDQLDGLGRRRLGKGHIRPEARPCGYLR
jgi:hypothetical protein